MPYYTDHNSSLFCSNIEISYNKMIECREIVNQVKEEVRQESLANEQTIMQNIVETPECLECKSLQKEFEKNPGGKPISKTGLILAGITGGAALTLSAICLPFVTPALRRYCLPYVPATNQQVENVLKALSKSNKHHPNTQKLVDIGSGDGRIVIASAKAGYQAHGIELNMWLVLYSRWRTLFSQGLKGKATFAKQDLWKSNLSKFQKVVIFGVEEMMPDLEKKLTKELLHESEVLACRFPFPNWIPDQVIGEGIDSVWLYKINKPNNFWS